MAKHHRSNRKVKKGARIEAPTEFREAIAYMQGVADAVSSRIPPEAGDDGDSRARARSPSHRPTVRYGEEPPTIADSPLARRRTLPYASSGPDGQSVHEAMLSGAPEIALTEELLERPSGIRLRCAPLQQEWYDLAGATGEQRRR